MPAVTISPEQAWQPLPKEIWTPAAARHLCARLGFSLQTGWIETFEQSGPLGLIKEALGRVEAMPGPESVLGMVEELGDYRDALREAGELEKRQIRQEMRKRNRAGYTDFAVDWCRFAREPRNSAREKLVLFVQDVWVVAFQGVQSTPALVDYQQRIRRHLGKSYPEMCKALAVSPAMVRYLNQNQNRKGSPNENFARELFELFCLGEGNYSEEDIKQAARALTGYTVNPADEVRFVKGRHDSGQKTLFGRSGNFGLEEVIDLVFEQPSAASFFPGEMARFYLTEEGLPDKMLKPLGDMWRDSGYSIPFLVQTFFSSRIFFDEKFRGNMIKAPVQFFIGLLQDLDLDVFPSPRLTTNVLRSMGQAFFNPPNVRGWVGGRHWINSATLSARNQVVNSLLHARMKNLNADEQMAVEEAEQAGRARFQVDSNLLVRIGSMQPDEAAEFLSERLHVDPDPAELVSLFHDTEAKWPRQKGILRLKAALTCPAYHLC